MRTLVISDLHLGSRRHTDLLRRPELREPLLDALAGVDRLVILGDALELREAPQREAAELAGPFFADVGRALGAAGELVLVAGNHDHGLVAPWIDARLDSEPSGFLGLEQYIEPEAASPLAARIADAAAPARVSVVYPGLWLRDDVYAIHGHYSDVHTTVPTFERVAAGAMTRLAVTLPERATPDDYEAVLAPLYAWMRVLTERADHTAINAGSGTSARAWVALAGEGRRRHPVRSAALRAGYQGAVTVLNRLGVGPIDRDLSAAALRRGGLRGTAESLRRLQVRAPWVLFGHTHRAGPFTRDDPADWVTPAGTRLINSGSWIYQPHFLGERPNGSPYWPGTAIELDDEGPPRLIRLLGDRGHDVLAPRVTPAAAVRSPA